MDSQEVERARVVAVFARFPDGREQWGSGYLVARDRVLTAWHCVVDRETHTEPTSWHVRRASDQLVADVVEPVLVSHWSGQDGNWGLDLALLTLRDPPWSDHWPLPRFARVDRTLSGELGACVAVGFPMFQAHPSGEHIRLGTAEVRGCIRRGDGQEQGMLELHDASMDPVQVPPWVPPGQARDSSPFGGLSGALVFHNGWALGHIVEHQPHHGAKVRLVPIDRVAAATGPTARKIADVLGLPSQGKGDCLPDAGEPHEDELTSVLDFPPRNRTEGAVTDPGGGTPSEVTDSTSCAGLLRAWVTPVPFVGKSRNEQLEKVLSWAEDQRRRAQDAGTRIAVYLITGPAGFGKTRLALEAYRRLGDAGWLAGFVTPSAADFSLLGHSPRPRFLILDDAVTHLDQFRHLIHAAESPSSANGAVWCLVVITRNEGQPAVDRVLDEYGGRVLKSEDELGELPPDEREAVYARLPPTSGTNWAPGRSPPLNGVAPLLL